MFGPYSIGGYSNDQSFANKHGFRFIEGDVLFLSAHIVFSYAMINADELMTIMKYKYKSYVNHEVNQFVDHNVYKLKSRQLFRHVLSTKCYGPDAKNKAFNRDNAGYILNDPKPQHQIITPDGH